MCFFPLMTKKEKTHLCWIPRPKWRALWLKLTAHWCGGSGNLWKTNYLNSIACSEPYAIFWERLDFRSCSHMTNWSCYKIMVCLFHQNQNLARLIKVIRFFGQLGQDTVSNGIFLAKIRKLADFIRNILWLTSCIRYAKTFLSLA